MENKPDQFSIQNLERNRALVRHTRDCLPQFGVTVSPNVDGTFNVALHNDRGMVLHMTGTYLELCNTVNNLRNVKLKSPVR